MEEKKQRKSIFETPLLSSKVKSANPKIFPEGALGYFIGPTLALIANSVLSTYLNRYFTEVLGLDGLAPLFLTLLPILSVILIIAGNIVVGRLMDHNRSRAGKARPLLLLAIPLVILAFLVLFIISPLPEVNDESSNLTTVLVLLAIGYNLWYAIAYPCYFTSHAALVNLSTRNSKSRSLLATIANATSLAAVGLCTMIVPFFLNMGILFVPKEGAAEGVLDVGASYTQWKYLAIILMVVAALGILCEYFFTRERITEESFHGGQLEERKKAIPVKVQAKICFRDKFWIVMIVFFFLYQLGGMLKNVSQLYFMQAWFADNIYNNLSGTLAIIGAVPTAVGMVIAWPLSNKIGKGKAILFGAILATIGGAIGFIAPNNFGVVAASFVVKALGSTPAMYLSLALLADILDHQEAQHGVRTDGFSMTFYGAIMAGMTGVATGIMNGVFSAVGRNAATGAVGSASYSDPISLAALFIFIGGETICYGVMFLMFFFMRVERFSKIDHIAIVLDQKAAAAAEGREYVDPAEKMRLEQEESDRKAEEARIAELKAKCEKNKINFEEEEAKYQAAQAKKQAAADAKKAAAEAKKAEKERLAKEKYDALPEEQRAALEAKKAEKARKQAEKDAKTLVEFNKLRVKAGKPELVLGEDGEYALVVAQPAEEVAE